MCFHVILQCVVESQVFMSYSSSHVHRNRPQPQLAPRYSPARGLARKRPGQETHPGQSHQVAAAEDRRPQAGTEKRAPGRARGRLRHPALPTSRPCGRRARNLAYAATGSRDCWRRVARTTAHAGNDRRPNPGPRLETGHRPGSGRSYRARLADRDPGARGDRRGRSVCRHGLAA